MPADTNRGLVEEKYRPFIHSQLHTIVFANGGVSSLLHEISHWFIAGEQRRKFVDYGYWYQPDGRDEIRQIEFEKVEVKPQSLEWIFSDALSIKFNPSADNIKNNNRVSESFLRNLQTQKKHFLTSGLPVRADLFFRHLTHN